MANATATRHARRDGEGARERLLSILRSKQRDGEAPPTVRELAIATGLSSSAVHYHLGLLRERGVLLPGGRGRRSGVVLARPRLAREA